MSNMSLYFFSLSVSELELSEGHLIESSLKAEVTHPYTALNWRVQHNTVLGVSKGNVNEKSGKTLNQSLQDFVQLSSKFQQIFACFVGFYLSFSVFCPKCKSCVSVSWGLFLWVCVFIFSN